MARLTRANAPHRRVPSSFHDAAEGYGGDQEKKRLCLDEGKGREKVTSVTVVFFIYLW